MKIQILNQDMKQLLDTTKYAVSKDFSRPILRYIKLDITAETITATSLNGMQLGQIKMPRKTEIAEPVTCLIQPIPLGKGDLSYVDLEVAEKCVSITVRGDAGDVTHTFIQNGDFVNVEQILANYPMPTEYIAVDATRLIAALKPFAKKGRIDYCQLRINKKANALFITNNSSSDAEDKITQMVLLVRDGHEEEPKEHKQFGRTDRCVECEHYRGGADCGEPCPTREIRFGGVK